MKPFRTVYSLSQFNAKAKGDFSFLWFGDKSTIYHQTFTFAMPHQWRKGSRGVKGDQF